MFKLKPIFVRVLCLSIGLVSGGVLFSQSQPRSVLAITHCHHCLDVNDLAGLLASVGIQKFSGLLPSVVYETDRTIAMQLPVVFQKWRWPCLHRPSEGIAVDKQANDDVVHLDRFRKANSLANQAFNARS